MILLEGDPFIVTTLSQSIRIKLHYKSEVVSLGVKMTYSDLPTFYPDFMFKVHPSRLITKDTRNVDVGLILNISNTLDFESVYHFLLQTDMKHIYLI